MELIFKKSTNRLRYDGRYVSKGSHSIPKRVDLTMLNQEIANVFSMLITKRTLIQLFTDNIDSNKSIHAYSSTSEE